MDHKQAEKERKLFRDKRTKDSHLRLARDKEFRKLYIGDVTKLIIKYIIEKADHIKEQRDDALAALEKVNKATGYNFSLTGFAFALASRRVVEQMERDIDGPDYEPDDLGKALAEVEDSIKIDMRPRVGPKREGA